jgi:aspartyl-tRNA(Asn)/glutamyl-tRNA(Gln) amidotransferase subunit B
MKRYEVVVGLEVHTELATRSKIFCGCPNLFGEAPNTLCCPVCAGLPGSLPVFNRKVLDYAILTGLATQCNLSDEIKFDRKNYFYPDLPKAYQISQLYAPIAREGSLEIILPENRSKIIRIREIHMEEDAGKLLHDPFNDTTRIDYNRCGVPLLEIVTEPDLRSGEEAILFILKLKSILEYLGVSDCRMQEGSLRTDINLSVRPFGASSLGVRTEMKNMNSLKAIARAIEKESQRQIELIESGGEIVQQTRKWDENKDASYPMRTKENAQDYRYFPEPDILPIKISKDSVDEIKRSLPELIDEKRKRYKEEYGLPDLDIDVLTSGIKLARLFEAAVLAGCEPKETANWVMGDLLKSLNDAGVEISNLAISASAFVRILSLVKKGTINRNAARKILAVLVTEAVDPDEYIEEHSLNQIEDDQCVWTSVEKAIQSNPKAVMDFQNGKEQVFYYLVGQVMKDLKGKASPDKVNELLRKYLNQSE